MTAGTRMRAAALLALAALVLLVASPAATLQVTSLVVLGDSIVDAGNRQNQELDAGNPDPTPAGDGYFDGRFSNGPVVADYLNDALFGGNSVASSEGGLNYSYGGARARDNSPADAVPDLAAQVNSYLGDFGAADPNALYFINAGGNDVRDILFGADANQTISDAVTEIVTQIGVLSFAGAQNFLVAGVGDVGAIPATIAFGQAAQQAGRDASEAFNAALFGNLPAGVVAFDTIAFNDAVVADPTAFGLPAGINLTEACLTAGGADPGGPPTCNDFAFFDSIHPTSQLHGAFADELLQVIPEPGTALLLALGLVGLASRQAAQR